MMKALIDVFKLSSQLLKNGDVLIVLLEPFFCLLDGDHQFLIAFGLLVELGVKFNKLSELRRAQFSTNFLSLVLY